MALEDAKAPEVPATSEKVLAPEIRLKDHSLAHHTRRAKIKPQSPVGMHKVGLGTHDDGIHTTKLAHVTTNNICGTEPRSLAVTLRSGRENLHNTTD